MPVAIPIIAAFASGAVGAVIAGTATFAAYASVAGAVLSVAGAVTHNKDLMRIGAIVGVVGGAASLIGAASNAAGSAAGSAATGIDEAVTAADYVNSADAASDAANAANMAGSAPTAPPIADMNMAANGGVPDPNAAAPPPAPDAPVSTSLAQQAVMPTSTPTTPTAITPAEAVAQSGIPGTEAHGGLTPEQVAYGKVESAASPVQQGVAGYSSFDLNSWWDKAMKTGKGVSKFMNENKELVNLAGGALKDMYGPQAEAMDYQRSLMDQARRNINSPVVLQLRKA